MVLSQYCRWWIPRSAYFTFWLWLKHVLYTHIYNLFLEYSIVESPDISPGNSPWDTNRTNRTRSSGGKYESAHFLVPASPTLAQNSQLSWLSSHGLSGPLSQDRKRLEPWRLKNTKVSSDPGLANSTTVGTVLQHVSRIWLTFTMMCPCNTI